MLIAAGICTAVCLALTIFAMQTKWDFTACGGILFACALAALNVYLDVLFIFLKIMRFFGRVGYR